MLELPSPCAVLFARLTVSKMKSFLQGPKAPQKMNAAKLSTPAMKETLKVTLNGILGNHVIDPVNICSS